MNFKQSSINECVYFRDNTIFLCYVDDTILINPSDENIDKVISEFEILEYDVSDEDQIDDYLGVKIQRQDNGSIKMTQPHLIDQILEDLSTSSTLLQNTEQRLPINQPQAQSLLNAIPMVSHTMSNGPTIPSSVNSTFWRSHPLQTWHMQSTIALGFRLILKLVTLKQSNVLVAIFLVPRIKV
jgi:hypothetical protein